MARGSSTWTVLFACLLLPSAASSIGSSSHALRLRTGLRKGLVAPAPAPAPVFASAPGPAFAPAASPASVAYVAPPGPGPFLPSIAAAPSAVKPEDELPVWPAHLPPPELPAAIPEPPPPPHAPPPEPAPPPQPPLEGQLVGPPPSEDSVEAIGNATEIFQSVPGLDLDGRTPLEVPNKPPPIPAPLPPPVLPLQIVVPPSDAYPEPRPLLKALLHPSPVAFGRDASRMLPAETTPLDVLDIARLHHNSIVAMPPLPDFAKLLSHNPAAVSFGIDAARVVLPSKAAPLESYRGVAYKPFRVLLSMSARRHTIRSAHA